jgi:hypothetical protein
VGGEVRGKDGGEGGELPECKEVVKREKKDVEKSKMK